MPLALTPRLLRRGLELFAVISFLGVVVVLVFFGQDPEGFLAALTHLRGGWLLLGLGLASMDWIGGGTPLWVVARHVHPGVRWRDMVIAGGMSAWAAYLTPFQTGAGPTDRKSTRLNSSHSQISYTAFCLKKNRDGLIRVRNIRGLNERFNTSITHAYSIVIGSRHITLNATGDGFVTTSKPCRHSAASKSK